MEAARIFEQESGTSPETNLSAIADRTEIRKAVQSGNVEEAIERVNDLNAEVRFAFGFLSFMFFPFHHLLPKTCCVNADLGGG